MPTRLLATNVFEAAVQRLEDTYSEGHRVVVSFSTGKDSGAVLELCKIAAERTGRLPVEAIMRDEEILLPGSFEYAERVAQDPKVDLQWVYACQPIINVFNRAEPYFWVFDPLLPRERWVREPPPYAYQIPEIDIKALTVPGRFPPPAGHDLFTVMGLRARESRNRRMGVLSQRGVRTLAPDQFGVRHIVPLYDWQVGDVWRAIHENGWDYNRAYDVMQRQGFKAASMRIAPLSMTPAEVPEVQMAARTWPGWFDRVCERLPGMRSVALFGVRVLEPTHHRSESWEQTFRRECVERAPKWIADRCRVSEETILRAHRHHATGGLPDVANCPHCHWGWRRMALELFNGDAFSQHLESLPYVQPDFFRPGSGRWDSRPN